MFSTCDDLPKAVSKRLNNEEKVRSGILELAICVVPWLRAGKTMANSKFESIIKNTHVRIAFLNRISLQNSIRDHILVTKKGEIRT
jgi:hypothetical protein